MSCRFEPGEIHALLGENGAGKSTLVGILAGFVRPSSGAVTLDGAALPLGDPLRSRAAGIELVHQHFTLASGLTIAENLELARMGTIKGWRSPAIQARAVALAQELGWASYPSIRSHPLSRPPSFYDETKAEDLGVATQQRVEIVKALIGEARVLILDEPTASLAPQEADDLFNVLRRLAGQGRTIILIAHKLAEVRAVATRATVLRRGRLIGTVRMDEISDDALAEMMLGRQAPLAEPTVPSDGATRLQLKTVCAASRGSGPGLEEIDFSVGNEIYGIGGVEGNGQGLLAEVLAGVAPYTGRIHVEGKPREMRDVVCGYIPEDRQRDAIAPGLSIARNLLVGIRQWHPFLTSRWREGIILESQLRRNARRAIEDYDIRTSGPEALAGSLSGGNAQKLVVARALANGPELVVAHNPTRGLDLGARETIHAALRESARGRPVVLLTSDLDELFALSSRTAFLLRGRLREGNDPRLMMGGDFS